VAVAGPEEAAEPTSADRAAAAGLTSAGPEEADEPTSADPELADDRTSADRELQADPEPVAGLVSAAQAFRPCLPLDLTLAADLASAAGLALAGDRVPVVTARASPRVYLPSMREP
jgi:hypothetical protein